MTDLNPEQRAEREAARRANGEFGTHAHSDPDVSLDAEPNIYRDVTSPFTVTVQLERWDHRDNAVSVGSVEFDARAILDAQPLSDLANLDHDSDWVVEHAKELGLVDHDGPYTLQLPDEEGETLEDYLSQREEQGMTEAYPSVDEALTAQATEHALEARREALATAARILAELGERGTTTKTVADLTAGDVLVRGAQRLTVDHIETSSMIFGSLAVETTFGTLYLGADEEVSVEVG
jgi:hypothetical protein